MAEPRRRDEIQGDIIHEYDGIEEADNQLPRWWLLTFYGAIAFAVGYWFYYEAYGMGPHQPEVFAEQLASRASEGGTVSPETLVMLSQDSATVQQGREIFETNCVACHGDRAQGVIGPNLTDNAWLHGGAPESIYTTVREGVQTKGMPAWGPTLGPRPVQAVVAYILTLRDTNVEGGRPAQGDPYEPGAAPADQAAPAQPSAPAAPEASGTDAPSSESGA